ncbi:hypothetical protein ACKJSM_03455 [Pseudomonas sp. PHC1]|uniref:hypothetical protein n=1 Tax=Pseudomonas sp. PHC1 TaxID=3384759 RepID=UPI00396F5B59
MTACEKNSPCLWRVLDLTRHHALVRNQSSQFLFSAGIAATSKSYKRGSFLTVDLYVRTDKISQQASTTTEGKSAMENSENTPILLLDTKELKLDCVILTNGKHKNVSGLVTDINEASKIITIKNLETNIETTAPLDSIKALHLTENSLEKALVLIRFANYVDTQGHTQFTLHNPADAQRPKPQIPESANKSTPHSVKVPELPTILHSTLDINNMDITSLPGGRLFLSMFFVLKSDITTMPK